MLGWFKRKPAVNVEEYLEVAVQELGVYLSSNDVHGVSEGFALLDKIYPYCDEHVQGQLDAVIKKYYQLLTSVGVYYGFIVTVVHVLNYCLFYLRVGGGKSASYDSFLV